MCWFIYARSSRGGGSLAAPKLAFTLAEVLITLGIIGVVAALTLPSLISYYNRHVVETRLEKFYSIMNQAVRLSENDYGEFQYWNNTTQVSNPKGMEEWWNTYFAPHIKTLRIENDKTASNGIIVYLVDGTKFRVFAYTSSPSEGAESNAIHLYFYPKSNNKSEVNGKDYFTFFIHANTNKKYLPVEPYKFAWDGTADGLVNGEFGCRKSMDNSGRHYCTALIQYNGWKIPKDYPFSF